MKIDMEELTKQRAKEIIEKGKYMKVEIIIPRVEGLSPVAPCVIVQERGTNTFTEFMMIRALELLIEKIKSNNKDLESMLKIIKTKAVEMGDEIDE